MSKKNGRNLEPVDYTSVEEFLDQYIDLSDGIPPTITKVIRAVRARFQIDNRYTKQSIIDAVQTYYSEHSWNPESIRNMTMAISNTSRDNSNRVRHRKESWQMPEHQKKAVSKALKGCRFITDPITGKRRYVAP
jgi:hypothetical protein